MSNKLDVRVLKSKNKLNIAILDLLRTKNEEAISVTELCRLASVNRNTFYSHYKDVSELVDEVRANYLEVFLKQIKDLTVRGESLQKVLTVLLESIAYNHDTYTILFKDRNDSTFLYTLVQLALSDAIEDLKLKSDVVSSFDINDYIIGGVVSMINSWIKSEFNTSPKVMSGKIAYVVYTFNKC